jgi:inward rectifier potassium channel
LDHDLSVIADFSWGGAGIGERIVGAMTTPADKPRLPSYQIRVVGATNAWFRDAHHAFLRMPWWAGLGIIIAGFLITNVLFGIAYALLGGVYGARPGSIVDGFYFSIQTMATIGY